MWQTPAKDPALLGATLAPTPLARDHDVAVRNCPPRTLRRRPTIPESGWRWHEKGIPARFMAVTFDSTPLARRELKAAMHPYDFTLRPQLVDSQMNPGYHRMIREFEKLTVIGAVLNTSFNLHGEPVVLGPAEALKAFEESGLPHLAMGHYLISKAQPKL